MSTLLLLVMMATRVFGLFILFPVFYLLSESYSGFSPLWAGITLGAYGLAQCVLQIPYGIASDKFGRKKILAFGFSMFALGSFIGAAAQSMILLFLARLLQGCGAVSSVLFALIADIVPQKRRGVILAIIGMVIGATFLLSLIVAPLLATWPLIQISHPLSGIFLLSGIAALICIGFLPYINTKKQHENDTVHTADKQDERTSTNKQALQSCCVSVFMIHAMLVIMFMLVPEILVEDFSITLKDHSYYYVIVIAASAPPVLLLMRMQLLIHKWRILLMLCACLAIFLFPLVLASSSNFYVLLTVLYMFFIVFSFLEGFLPNLVSRSVPQNHRGRAMGYYASSLFLGSFIGGLVAGVGQQYLANTTFMYVIAGIASVWLCALYKI